MEQVSFHESQMNTTWKSKELVTMIKAAEVERFRSEQALKEHQDKVLRLQFELQRVNLTAEQGPATTGRQARSRLGGLLETPTKTGAPRKPSSSMSIGIQQPYGDPKDQNVREKVPVPSSEHVAEIVGRQGCKIKALRTKTNTYIQTPQRNSSPVFEVTGRGPEVSKARNEILAAAEHFTRLRSDRRAIQGLLARGGGVLLSADGMVETAKPLTPEQVAMELASAGKVQDTLEVPFKLVGLVVGAKGQTIKRIQQETRTYIITPSRESAPLFVIMGTRGDVASAKSAILEHIISRTSCSSGLDGKRRGGGPAAPAASALSGPIGKWDEFTGEQGGGGRGSAAGGYGNVMGMTGRNLGYAQGCEGGDTFSESNYPGNYGPAMGAAGGAGALRRGSGENALGSWWQHEASLVNPPPGPPPVAAGPVYSSSGSVSSSNDLLQMCLSSDGNDALGSSGGSTAPLIGGGVGSTGKEEAVGSSEAFQFCQSLFQEGGRGGGPPRVSPDALLDLERCGSGSSGLSLDLGFGRGAGRSSPVGMPRQVWGGGSSSGGSCPRSTDGEGEGQLSSSSAFKAELAYTPAFIEKSSSSSGGGSPSLGY